MSANVIKGVRYLLGLMMLVFGLNKFLNFIPVPPMEGDAATLMGIYGSSGFMTIIAVIEILGGIALLAGKFVPLALTFLTAVMFNAVLFHLFHDIGGIPGAAVGFVLCLLVIFGGYKSRFSDLLSP